MAAVMHMSSSFPRRGTPGCRWGNWGLCGDFAAYLCPGGRGNEGPLIYYAPDYNLEPRVSPALCQRLVPTADKELQKLWARDCPDYGEIWVLYLASAKAQGNWERAFIVLYAFNQPWGTFTANVLEKNKISIFCRTKSKTKQVKRTKLLFLKCRGKRGN